MKLTDYAHLAGQIDGDGCIVGSKAFVPRSNCFQYDVKIEVTSKVRRTSQELIRVFGGYSTHGFSDNTEYWKWNIRITNASKEFLEKLTPYLVLKQEQAKVASEWANIKRYANVPDTRKDIVDRIQYLNQNHTAHFIDIPSFEEQESFAYLAGLVDAEGTLSIIQKERKSTSPYIVVYNDSLRVLTWIERAFKGRIYLHKEPNHYAWTWVGTPKERVEFVRSIVPYLTTKSGQGEVLLEYASMLKTWDRNKRKELFNRMYALNHPLGTSEANMLDTAV